MSELVPTVGGGSLIPVLADLGVSKYGSDEDFAALSSGGGFLARMMLFGTNSKLVQEEKIKAGAYGLVKSKDEFEDLTKEVQVIPLSVRAKAMEISGDEITTVYDRNNEEFKRIAEKSEISDSGCMYGVEFLLWLPVQKVFTTWYASSKTSRREAPLLKNLMGRPARMSSKLIKGKKYNWHGPVITVSSIPISPDGVPSQDAVVYEVNRFNNPPVNEKEAAPADAGGVER
jgi:DNA gyrase inhibitor GyrI